MDQVFSSSPLQVDKTKNHKCPSKKLRDVRRSVAFILSKRMFENNLIRKERDKYFDENNSLIQEKCILERESYENNQLIKENLSLKELNATLDRDNIAALIDQKQHYIDRHELIIVKLKERFSTKFNDVLKSLHENITLISTENENLKKKSGIT